MSKIEEESDLDFIRRKFEGLLIEAQIPWSDSLLIRHSFELKSAQVKSPWELPTVMDEELNTMGFEIPHVTDGVKIMTKGILRQKGLTIEGVKKMRKDHGIDERFQYPGD